MHKVVQVLQPESVKRLIKLVEDADNKLVVQDAEPDPPDKQVINQLLKGLIDIMVKT